MKDEYDFSQGKRGAIQPIEPHQTRLMMVLDNDILDWFRTQVEESGGGDYQQLINQILREYIEQQSESFENIMRRVIREELLALRPPTP